jgi:hypothetical protein
MTGTVSPKGSKESSAARPWRVQKVLLCQDVPAGLGTYLATASTCSVRKDQVLTWRRWQKGLTSEVVHLEPLATTPDAELFVGPDQAAVEALLAEMELAQG